MLREHFAVITRRTAPVGFDSEKPQGRSNVEAGSSAEFGNSAQRDATRMCCRECEPQERRIDRVNLPEINPARSRWCIG